nr:JUN-1B [Caenorhabditis elegans]
MMNNSFDMNVTQHTNSSPYRRQDMEVDDGEKESTAQYCKGFYDALRVMQTTNKYEFTGGAVSSPVLPVLQTAAFSPITPASASDMHTIVMSLLGNTPITSGPSIAPLSSPTLLPLVTSGDLDDLSMKILASSAIPGPPIISSSNSPDSSTTAVTTSQITAFQPLLNNFVSSTTASTSRPGKLNLTPPQQSAEIYAFNGVNSDDSDGGLDSRSASRCGMALDDQEKKKLERKRARNRQAATKCRQKKMDRIKELEEQVLHEKHRGQRLDAELLELNRALEHFRRTVEHHSGNGCPNNSIRV